MTLTNTSTFESFHLQWIEAFNSRDLDGHMALYAEEAVLFGSVDELQIGGAQIRDYFSRRPPGMRVASYPMPRVAIVESDLMTTAGHVDFADGDTPLPYRMTWVLLRRQGNWLIVQHHGSPRLSR